MNKRDCKSTFLKYNFKQKKSKKFYLKQLSFLREVIEQKRGEPKALPKIIIIALN